MATDLAKLVVSLEAQNAQILSKLEQTEKRMKTWEARTRSVTKSVANAFKGLFAGAAVAGAFRSIVKATEESENALAQMNAALKSTGGAAGVTAREIQDLASQLQSKSTFDDEAIINLQTRLLSFGKVTKQVFGRATQDALDLATRLKIDLNSAALLVGKALNDPINGLQGLARAGVTFDASQKAVIKSLAETGRVAEAQQVILGELEKKFGGAAEAARGTFGGALAGLGNAFHNLLEAPGGMGEATASLNQFTSMLEDPQTKAAAETFMSSLVMGFGLVTSAIVKSFDALVQLGEKLRSQQWFKDIVDKIGGAFSGSSGAVLAGSGRIERPGAAGGGAAAAAASTPAVFDEKAWRKMTQLKLASIDATMAASDAQWDAYQKDIQGMREAYDKEQEMIKAQQRYRLAQIDNTMALIDASMVGMKGKYDEMTEFARQAARNMQDAFADFLFDPFQGGLRGMLSGFVDTLRRMAAEAIASRVFDMIGAWGKSNAGGGGILGSIANVAGSFFGKKDGGGSVPAGGFAIAGEHGPELIRGPASVTSRVATARLMSDSGRQVTRIYNYANPDEAMAAYLSTPDGEKAILNIWTRHSRRMRTA